MVVLDALLAERNVTRAAERVHLSQRTGFHHSVGSGARIKESRSARRASYSTVFATSLSLLRQTGERYSYAEGAWLNGSETMQT